LFDSSLLNLQTIQKKRKAKISIYFFVGE